VQVHLSSAASDDEALAIAHDQWRTNIFSSELAWNLETPAQLDAAARHVRPDDLVGSVLVSADCKQHAAWLQEIADLGVDELYVHHVGTAEHQVPFIEAFAEHVLPEVT
jgi:hypothetical protein